MFCGYFNTIFIFIDCFCLIVRNLSGGSFTIFDETLWEHSSVISSPIPNSNFSEWTTFSPKYSLYFSSYSKTWLKHTKEFANHVIEKFSLNENNQIISQQKTWNWHYSPKERSFNEIVDEFSHLLNDLIKKKINDKSILLPLSSGLDSRSLFVSVKTKPNLTLSSYEFEGGFSETETAKELSKQFNSNDTVIRARLKRLDLM